MGDNRGAATKTHLIFELHKRGYLVGEDGVDSPTNRCAHFTGVIDSPHTHLLASGATVPDKRLALGADEHTKGNRKALARIPKVAASERSRNTNVVATKTTEVLERRTDKDRVPQAENQTRRELGLPVGVRLDDTGHGRLAKVSASRIVHALTNILSGSFCILQSI